MATTTISQEEVKKVVLDLPAFKSFLKFISENMKAFKKLKAGASPAGNRIRVHCKTRDYSVDVKFNSFADDNEAQSNWMKRKPTKSELDTIVHSLTTDYGIPGFKELNDKANAAYSYGWMYFGKILNKEIAQTIPEVYDRAREVHACAVAYVQSGAINKKKDTHQKQVHMFRLKKHLIAGIKSGLDKKDILLALDEAICKSIMTE